MGICRVETAQRGLLSVHLDVELLRIHKSMFYYLVRNQYFGETLHFSNASGVSYRILGGSW